MGILGRLTRKTRGEWLYDGAVRWEPLNRWHVDKLEGAAADMDDAGQAGRTAYEVVFWSPDVPGSLIVVCTYAFCTYAAETRPQEVFWKGLRYTYHCATSRDWSYTGWEKDPQNLAYGDAAEADLAALGLAGRIADGVMAPDPGWATAMLPTIFGWDGQRFDVPARASGEES